MENSGLRTKEKYGECNSPSLTSERLLVNYLHLSKETQEGSSKVHFIVISGAALLRRMHRYGFLSSEELKLDYVLGLTVSKILDKRLQSRINQYGFYAKSIHQARCLIRQKHVKVGKNLVDAAQFLVRSESEKKINLAPSSPFETKKPGRTSRKKNKGKKQPAAEE